MKIKYYLPDSALSWAVFFLGLSTFLPVGLTYLFIFFIFPFAVQRMRGGWEVMDRQWIYLSALILIWPLTSLLSFHGDMFFSRYGHMIRIVLCLIVALMMHPAEQYRLMQGFMVGGIFALSIVAVNAIHGLPRWSLWHQLLSVQGNASSQKWIMLAILPSVCILIAGEIQTRRSKYFLFALAVFASVAVLTLSISRNSHLVLLFCGFLALSYMYRSPRRWFIAFAVFFLSAVAAYFASDAIQSRFGLLNAELQRYFGSGDFNSSVGVRAHMYLTALKSMQSHMIFGTGLGSWEVIWADAAVAYPDMMGLNNPHNDFLLWGMESGLPGFLTLVLLLAKILVKSWRANNNYAGVGWLMGWALLITTLVNAPFRDGALGMSLLILSVALSRMSKPPSSDPTCEQSTWEKTAELSAVRSGPSAR